ncbi:hypothetical protein, partial [Paraburkholderia sediminicola]|uniref:hypothetical protein n=1 Tax=Paraburkholderia sediminicola TaxID=458836 RepID=UPI0038B9D6CD
PLSFAYFSLRPAKKSSAAPHRGNANKPLTNQGKANTASNQTKRRTGRKKPPITLALQKQPQPALTDH